MESIYIDIHTHKEFPSGRAVRTYSIGMDAEAPISDTFSAGIHPRSAADTNVEDALAYLRVAPVVAIGEIGLDYARETDIIAQTKILEAQLKIAEERSLPVILHCVRAYNDMLHILGGFRLKAVIFHGYTGSPEQTATIIKKGYYISVGERSLESPKTIEALRRTPLDHIFAETDESDSPIETIYGKLAAALQIPLPELQKAIMSNYKKIFG